MDTLFKISENLRYGRATEVAALVKVSLENGLNWKIILEKGLFQGMSQVAELFKEEEIYFPEVIMAAKAMEAGQQIIEPLMFNSGRSERAGKVILGTVKGDVHNLGKNLVRMMLKGAGFEVIDIGEDVAAENFVSSAISNNAHVVGMSALLTTTMPNMKSTIVALKEAGLEGKVKTIIGGACVTQQYANEIGADAYASNAGEAVEKVIELIK